METAKDIITSLAALAAVIIGFMGLRTWKLQLKATADTELARKILIALYKVRAAVAMIRRPLREVSIPPHESRPYDLASKEAFANQYQDEWRIVSNEMAGLEALAIEAQAVWDSDFPKSLIDLRLCLSELRLSEHLKTERDSHHDSYIERKDLRQVLYGIGGESDAFGRKIDDAIKLVDLKVRPHFVN